MALELNRAVGKAEGVVLGLESTKAITSQIAEPLYVPYDDAASNRAGELKGWAFLGTARVDIDRLDASIF